MSTVEKAKTDDVPQMHQLINYFADREEMLPRELHQIYENIRDYFVVRQDEKVIACVALSVYESDLAEIRSLAVAEGNQGKGFGARLVRACLDEAREIGVGTVFCLTYQPVFFEKLGFRRHDKMELPRKIWSECYQCPKFPDCGEIALIYEKET